MSKKTATKQKIGSKKMKTMQKYRVEKNTKAIKNFLVVNHHIVNCLKSVHEAIDSVKKNGMIDSGKLEDSDEIFEKVTSGLKDIFNLSRQARISILDHQIEESRRFIEEIKKEM